MIQMNTDTEGNCKVWKGEGLRVCAVFCIYAYFNMINKQKKIEKSCTSGTRCSKLDWR